MPKSSDNKNQNKSNFLSSVLDGTTNVTQKQSTIDSQNITNDSQPNTISDQIANKVADTLIKEAKESTSKTVNTQLDKVTSLANKPIKAMQATHQQAPLSLAIVGHTNTGKTSLLRTLLRDSNFGMVQNSAATTRHVEKITIYDKDTLLVDLFDTPGLEDASSLLDWLEDNTNPRADGVERLQTMLADEQCQEQFNQEIKVIKQLLNSDVAMYVIDAREPVLGKYKDELQILSWCAKPIMPIFNFIHFANEQSIQSWQSMLATRNLHVSSQFDTVAFDFDGEILLWNNLNTLLSNNSISNPILTETVTQLISARQAHWQDLKETSFKTIAHTLISISAFQRHIYEDDDSAKVLTEMQNQVRQLERKLHKNLLNLYQFYNSDIEYGELNLSHFQRDPFDAEILKDYGIRTTSGAVAGALAGLSIDAATFGASLGLGAAMGGVIGSVLSNTGSITRKITGKQTLHIDPETITLIATRAVALLNTLQHRGHAHQSKSIDGSDIEVTPLWQANKLPKILKKARSKSEWSELNTQNKEQSHALREPELIHLIDDLNILD